MAKSDTADNRWGDQPPSLPALLLLGAGPSHGDGAGRVLGDTSLPPP